MHISEWLCMFYALLMYDFFLKRKRIKTHFLKLMNKQQNIELKYTKEEFTKYNAKKLYFCNI
ncbi:hypothetical protein F9277_01330 [Vibrio harveyi]|nr:hypothetical protein F9277_01330 [Vibrio harveyi]